MEDELLYELVTWLEDWRELHAINDDLVLSENMVEIFVEELQAKITTVIGDFGPATSGFENAKLVLYTGTDFNVVNDFCISSNGEYYMINQTKASILWNPIFRKNVANVIGEINSDEPISAAYVLVNHTIRQEDGLV